MQSENHYSVAYTTESAPASNSSSTACGRRSPLPIDSACRGGLRRETVVARPVPNGSRTYLLIVDNVRVDGKWVLTTNTDQPAHKGAVGVRHRSGVRPFGLDSVGINRREVVNERFTQERSSESILTPNHVRADRKDALEALGRGTCRLGIPKQ